MQATKRARAASQRGFTLVELLVVVAMIGVLAAMALVGYRKYMNTAGSSEAKAVMQGIRGAQEAYKAEMLVYLDCSGTLNNYYPVATPDAAKHGWNDTSHPNYALWQQLNVTTDGAVRFVYAVVAGQSATITAVPDGAFTWAGLNPVQSPLLPPITDAPNGPWFAVQAAGDRDEDGAQALFLTASTMPGIYWENDSE